MGAITKSELAAELGVSKARISQYVKEGLPVRSDGKLDRDVALNHLRIYRTSQAGSDKGPARAAKLLRTGPQTYVKSEAELQPEWITRRWSTVDRAKIDAVKDLVRRSRSVLARVALEAGASIEMAYAIAELGQYDLLGAADDLLEDEGVPGWSPFHHGLTLNDRGLEPEWQRFAEVLGQSFDQEHCEAMRAALPVMQDKPRLGYRDEE